MNAIQRHELYVLEQGESPVEVFEDTKIPNAATIKIVKQDHTLANMLRQQLLANSAILFAGYKVPHPLNPYFELKIQTDGSLTPTAALEKASNELIALAKTIQNKFVIEFQYSEREQDALGAGANLGGMGTIGRIGDGIDGTYGDEAAWSGKDYLNDI